MAAGNFIAGRQKLPDGLEEKMGGANVEGDGLVFMMDFAKAFERRWRDARKRNHCLSIEHRYDSGKVWVDGSRPYCGRYGEDALVLAMWAWGDIPRGVPDLREALRISFGMGAKSQTAYENELEDAVVRMGLAELHRRTDTGLLAWLEAIRLRAGEDFDLLFEGLK